MAEDNFDEEFARTFDAIKKLEQRIEALERPPKDVALERIVLSTPDGKFRVLIALKAFELTATPMTQNQEGKWILGQAVGVNARWMLDKDGKTFIHFSST